MQSSIRWLWNGFIVLLILIGVGASASFYFRTPANPDFAKFPLITALHVIPGGIYLALAPFQFMPSIRRRSLTYHRRAGRLLVVLSLIAGFTSIFITLIIPYAGWTQRLVVGPFAMGFIHIRARRIDQHQAWMIRAFAIGLSIATQRLLFVPPLVYLIVQSGGEPSRSDIEPIVVVCFMLSFIIHTAVAELWIHRLNKHKSEI